MYVRALLVLVLAFVACDVVRAQVSSTATLYPIGFGNDKLQGEQIGTGPGGTTYQLSGTFNSLSIPYTMTLVQDSTHVSEVAVLVTSGTSIIVSVNCGFGNGGATCTEVIVEGGAATIFTESGTPSPVAIPVAIASLDPNFTGTAQPPTGGLGTGLGSTSGPGSGNPSILPPTIAVTQPASGGLTTPTATSTGVSGAVPGVGADALRMALVAWFVATVMAATTGLALVF